MLQPFFHFFNEAFGHVVVKAQFRIAHYLEGVCGNAVIVEHEENIVQTQSDDVVHKDDVVAAG